MPTDISTSSVAIAESVTACATVPPQNIHEIDDDGHSILGWCFVPRGNLVAGDVVLAQEIALETNETGALAVANRFPVQVPRRR